MAVRSTRGLKICIGNDKAAGADIAAGLSNITNASPAVVTVTDTTGATTGDVVTFKDTGTALDNAYFTVGTVTSTTIEVIGADLTALSGPVTAFGTTPKVMIYTDKLSKDLSCICASSIDYSTSSPSPISIATFCDPSASVPGQATDAGTMTINVYPDPADAGFKALEKLFATGNKTFVRIMFPGDQGALLAEGTVSDFSISSLPLEGAVGWTVTFTLASRPILRV